MNCLHRSSILIDWTDTLTAEECNIPKARVHSQVRARSCPKALEDKISANVRSNLLGNRHGSRIALNGRTETENRLNRRQSMLDESLASNKTPI